MGGGGSGLLSKKVTLHYIAGGGGVSQKVTKGDQGKGGQAYLVRP